MPIYTDSLQNSWDNWSWDATVGLSSPSVVHSAPSAISVTLTAGWGAFSLHHTALDTTPYSSITFWINGGPTGGQRLQFAALLEGNIAGTTNLPTLAR